MKLTINHKRHIVVRFKEGRHLFDIAKELPIEGFCKTWGTQNLEQVLRDFILGKFTLTTRRKGKS